ncbi:MAG: hypothetical protein GF417_00695 [Candidatus Latescibacteria bacterium]|nr:hypothetical protein [bacterium]MBD3422944.1 hypothetical protein [Candidatus Latescibacterota bacterium]
MKEVNGKREKVEGAGRPERTLAWSMIAAGAVILLGWVLYRFVSRLHTITVSVGTVSAGLIIAGAVILFISVLVERIRERKTDRYRDIEK